MASLPRLARTTLSRQTPRPTTWTRAYADNPKAHMTPAQRDAVAVRRQLRVRKDPIPFELPPDVQRAVDDAASDGEEVLGTITPVERRAFRQLFRDLSKQTAAAQIMSDATTEQVSAQEQRRAEAAEDRVRIGVLGRLDETPDSGDTRSTNDDHDDHDQSTRALLDEIDAVARHLAIRPSTGTAAGTSASTRSADEDVARRRREAMLARFPASLRRAAAEALGLRERRMQTAAAAAAQEASERDAVDEKAERRRVREAQRMAHLRTTRQAQMERAMYVAPTDVALWQYMETHVFALTEELGLHDTLKRTGRRSEAGKTSPKTRRDPRKDGLRLAVYGPLYPALLLHGLRLLGSHFGRGRYSPLFASVLPRAKQLGLASYVLGAGAPLYNELLRIHWARRGDAPAVFALLQEMQHAGIAYDVETLAIVKSMAFHYEALRRADPGAAPSFDLDSAHRPVAPSAFVQAALQHVPDVAAAPALLRPWKRLVNGVVYNKNMLI